MSLLAPMAEVGFEALSPESGTCRLEHLSCGNSRCENNASGAWDEAALDFHYHMEVESKL